MSRNMIKWLYDLQHFGVKLGLHNISALLRVLDHPEQSYPSVLIAGTNGKGSVAAMTASMFRATGVKTGLFTSPHLIRPNERIRIDGRDIASSELDRQLSELRETIHEGLRSGDLDTHPSFFEVITATALKAFKDHAMQLAVLEVGLGGKLDATNAVEADVSVVVSIGLDHVKTLGGTIEKIAGEKAGIIKRGRPVISGVVQESALAVLENTCREREARFIDARSRVRLVSEVDGVFSLESDRAHYPSLALALPGRHQIDNARIAIAVYEQLAERVGHTVDPAAVRVGLAAVHWPGRLQWIKAQHGRPSILLDAAHNLEGMVTLASYLTDRPSASPVLLFGTTRGKPLQALLEQLAHFTDRIVICRPPVEKGLDVEEVAAVARPLFKQVRTAPDPSAALEQACALADEGRYVLVTGSLYLVGNILGVLECVSTPGQVSL